MFWLCITRNSLYPAPSLYLHNSVNRAINKSNTCINLSPHVNCVLDIARLDVVVSRDDAENTIVSMKSVSGASVDEMKRRKSLVFVSDYDV
jgi:hypothetical protein